MAKRKSWIQELSREPGTMSDSQRASIERRIPEWKRAHAHAGVLDNFSCDWEDGPAFEAQCLIYGMSTVIRDLLSRPAV